MRQIDTIRTSRVYSAQEYLDTQPSVFLDENNSVKLGDFGLSKALAQTSFASTYVGVRHRQGPIPAYTHLFLKDSILHVT